MSWHSELTVVGLLALCFVLNTPSSFPVTSWGRISCDTCSVLVAAFFPQAVGCSSPIPYSLGHLSSVSCLAWLLTLLQGVNGTVGQAGLCKPCVHWFVQAEPYEISEKALMALRYSVSFWVLMSALQDLSMEQLAFLSACSLTYRIAEGRGWVQWSIAVKICRSLVVGFW